MHVKHQSVRCMSENRVVPRNFSSLFMKGRFLFYRKCLKISYKIKALCADEFYIFKGDYR